MALISNVILDDSVLLGENCPDDGNASFLKPGAETLLRTLSLSKLRVGISHGANLSSEMVDLLRKMATPYSCKCFMLDLFSSDNLSNKIRLELGDVSGNIVYVVSWKKEVVIPRLKSFSSPILVLNSGFSCLYDIPNIHHIEKLEELPLSICHLNKEAIGGSTVIVGYIMKPSRIEEFTRRGAFPLCPTPNGLMFAPLTSETPLSLQLNKVDVILHKATDKILSIEASSSPNDSAKVNFSSDMQEVQMHLDRHPGRCIIDPLCNVLPLLDRLKIQDVLLGLEDDKAGSGCVRGPHFLKIENYSELNLPTRLSEAGLSLPVIVKPQVACGVTEAHKMAIVFNMEDFHNLSVPLPAIIQEYVNHSATVFKFYVLGEKVFHAVRKSTPNADALVKSSNRDGPKCLLFDSLKSLPIDNDDQQSRVSGCPKIDPPSIDHDLVTDAANKLRRMLQLTVFGFDVVIQEGTGDHVIVDVNYLPSFKEVPDDIAIPTFWEAIRNKFDSKDWK